MFLVSYATLHCDQNQLVQIDTSLQHLLDQRKQENLTLKLTLSRQGNRLVRGDEPATVCDDFRVWQKKFEARKNAKRQIESEIDQLKVDNEELEEAIAWLPSAPPGSPVRHFWVPKRRLDRLFAEAEVELERSNREDAVWLRRAQSEVEQLNNEITLLQMQIGSLDGRIELMRNAMTVSRKGLAQRQREIEQMEQSYIACRQADQEQRYAGPQRQGRFAPRKPVDLALPSPARVLPATKHNNTIVSEPLQSPPVDTAQSSSEDAPVQSNVQNTPPGPKSQIGGAHPARRQPAGKKSRSPRKTKGPNQAPHPPGGGRKNPRNKPPSDRFPASSPP
jgi:hypothetical protein